jgi:hypothetical protein
LAGTVSAANAEPDTTARNKTAAKEAINLFMTYSLFLK